MLSCQRPIVYSVPIIEHNMRLSSKKPEKNSFPNLLQNKELRQPNQKTPKISYRSLPTNPYSRPCLAATGSIPICGWSMHAFFHAKRSVQPFFHSGTHFSCKTYAGTHFFMRVIRCTHIVKTLSENRPNYVPAFSLPRRYTRNFSSFDRYNSSTALNTS